MVTQALAYAAMLGMWLADSVAALVALTVVFVLRMAAVHLRITLPSFVAR